MGGEDPKMVNVVYAPRAGVESDQGIETDCFKLER